MGIKVGEQGAVAEFCEHPSDVVGQGSFAGLGGTIEEGHDLHIDIILQLWPVHVGSGLHNSVMLTRRTRNVFIESTASLPASSAA